MGEEAQRVPRFFTNNPFQRAACSRLPFLILRRQLSGASKLLHAI